MSKGGSSEANQGSAVISSEFSLSMGKRAEVTPSTNAANDAADMSGAGASEAAEVAAHGGTPEGFRVIDMNDVASNHARGAAEHWDGNGVSTARYNLLTFLPKNLFEFFRIVANLYFLVISLIQVTTTLSPTNPYTTITPLTIVFIITLIKNGVEDWKRHQADAEMNARPARVMHVEGEGHRHEWELVAWRDIKVGDVVVVRDREEVPADIVVLASSEEEGRCFIETSNLDGETNLKRREALRGTAQRIGWRGVGEPMRKEGELLRAARGLRGKVAYEPPSKSLYTFVGAAHVEEEEEKGTGGKKTEVEKVPINPDSVILRGCQLRSCAYVLGLVLYTGRDTRLMKNQRAAPTKQSNVYRQVNRYILLIFATQFILCLASAIAFAEWRAQAEDAWYLGSILNTSAGEAVTSFFTFLILYNNLVPISLYVSLDVIKVTQAKFMEADAEMCLVEEDNSPSSPDNAAGSTIATTPAPTHQQQQQPSSFSSSGAAGASSATAAKKSTNFARGSDDGDVTPSAVRPDDHDPKSKSKSESKSKSKSSKSGKEDTSPPEPLESTRTGYSVAPGVSTKPPKRKWAKARTSDLNEDLGQVEYIFSDKTGTLTQNRMEFRKCSIGGFAYGFGTTEIGRAAMARAQAAGAKEAAKVAGAGVPGILDPDAADRLSDAMAAQAEPDPGIAFDDPRLLEHLAGGLTEAEARGEAPTTSDLGMNGRFRDGLSSMPDAGTLGGGQGGEEGAAPPERSSGGSSGAASASASASASAGEFAAQQAARIREFLTLLSVCHTVIPEVSSTGKVEYRASSPDEEALVKAAKCLGFDLVAPAPRTRVRVGGEDGRDRTFEVVGVNEFNSKRKRMSVVVRDPETGDGTLYCKGADNVMFERIGDWGGPLPHAPGKDAQEVLTEQLRIFAGEGLRTLVLARRSLTKAEVDEWENDYAEAAGSLEGRTEKLEDVAEKIEKDLILVGATAIEDKLQDGVPDAIATLARAGIKIWVLTGDKEETAINIGYACRLLDDSMLMIRVNAPDEDALSTQLDRLCNSRDSPLFATSSSSNSSPSSPLTTDSNSNSNFNSNTDLAQKTTTSAEDKTALTAADPTAVSAKPNDKKRPPLALVIDGKALGAIFHKGHEADKNPMAANLLRVARECRAVVACRVSPSQKADIVSLVRHGVTPTPITLAIGDGANDVNMIQTAHVGVGISGNEGVQAVNSSDYAIAQFRFLERLLLVHGRLNYQRISKTILYSFYKNVALVSILFLFQFYTGFSGTTLFESFVQAGWNFFTAFPILSIGVEDHDVPDKVASRFPGLYAHGPANKSLNLGLFAVWLLNGLYHAILVFFLHLPVLTTEPWTRDGLSQGLFVAGYTVYTSLLLAMQYKVMLLARRWTRVFVLFLLFSFFLFVAFSVVYAFIALNVSPGFFYVPLIVVQMPNFWFHILLVPVITILLDVVVSVGSWVIDGPTTVDALRLLLFGPTNLPFCPDVFPMAPSKHDLRQEIPKGFTMKGDNLDDLVADPVPGAKRSISKWAKPAAAIRIASALQPRRGKSDSDVIMGVKNADEHLGFDFSYCEGTGVNRQPTS